MEVDDEGQWSLVLFKRRSIRCGYGNFCVVICHPFWINQLFVAQLFFFFFVLCGYRIMSVPLDRCPSLHNQAFPNASPRGHFFRGLTFALTIPFPFYIHTNSFLYSLHKTSLNLFIASQLPSQSFSFCFVTRQYLSSQWLSSPLSPPFSAPTKPPFAM